MAKPTRKRSAAKSKSAKAARKAKSAPARAAAPEPAPAAAPRPAPGAPQPAPPDLRVRMYRQGLGDCFLVTLPKDDGTPFRIMIDCGVIIGTRDPEVAMRKVVRDIIDETGGKVDLLVVTHQHWDHVSGFVQVEDLFAPHDQPRCDRLAVGAVWFAWTEDPSDELAARLRREREERVNKLAGFVDAMSGNIQPEARGIVSGVGEVLGFFGIEGERKPAKSTSEAMDIVRTLSGNLRYCRPGEKPITLPGLPGVRFFVLGPPHDEKLLRKTDSATEIYHLSDLGAPASFFAAAGQVMMAVAGNASDRARQEEADQYYPFDRSYRRALQPALRSDLSERDALSDFFDRYYYGQYPDATVPDQGWRRIDGDWLGAAAEFALQLDSATNNTSLVLAIELVATGKVLLFVADAQVGNWLSWGDVSFRLDDNSTVTAQDLLRRTVFYKVGHHGSENATLREKGLELMRADDLVAFIPVDEEMAKRKHWNRMPLANLLKALDERAKYRVVRVDKEFNAEADMDKDPNRNRDAARAFARRLRTTELYHEWSMPLD